MQRAELLTLVATYLRVSSEEQAMKETIDNQRALLTKHLFGVSALPVTREYPDDGVHGTIPLEQRPAGRQLVEDARTGRFNTLVVYRLDRLGRTLKVAVDAVYLLRSLNIRVICIGDGFDSASPMAEPWLGMLAGYSGWERQSLLERTALGRARAQAAGIPTAPIAPYGYMAIGREETRQFVLNHGLIPGFELSEVDVVVWNYNHITRDRGSLISAARWLNEQGIPTRFQTTGRHHRATAAAGASQWQPATIQQIVKNPLYKGIRRYGHKSKTKRVVELPFEESLAIVSEEQWGWAQERLRENSKWPVRNQKREYLLSGLIRCACGSNFQGKPSFNGKQWYLHYTCGRRLRAQKGTSAFSCPSRSIPCAHLEEDVWNHLAACLQNPSETIRRLLIEQDGVRDRIDQERIERTRLVEARDQLAEERARILKLFRKGKITEAEADDQLDEIEKEKQSLSDRITLIDGRTDALLHWDREVVRVEDAIRACQAKIAGQLSFLERQEIVRALVKEITVETLPETREPRIEVVFRFQNPLLSLASSPSSRCCP